MQPMDQAELAAEQSHEAQDFHRGLKNRHVQLIALGGAIGVGLFLGAGRAISQAGPGLIFVYAFVGLLIFFMMRALGELLLHRPVAGSFATYAEEYVSPLAGFVTGWSYWFMWVVTGMAEITAVGIYTHFWLPDVPQWVPALITLGVLYSLNLIAVKVFGEVEFWFALIKVVAILLLLVAGPVFMIFGTSENAQAAGFSNLWAHGGIFPTGVLGVVLALQMVTFAFLGVELIGVTAGEVENPEKVLPRATNAIVWRILIFYIGALIVMMMLVPWTEFSEGQSPFVMVFERMGLPAAAGIINFVVITAAASSCNSGIFSTGRMLYTLAHFGQAPKAFGKVNRSQVPATGITLSAIVMLFGVVLNYFVPDEVFVYVTSVALVAALWTWGMIVLAHLGYRRALARGEAAPVSFRMPGAPFTNWMVLIFLVAAFIFLAFDPATRVALYVAPVWFAILGVAYYLLQRRKGFAPV